MTLEQLGLTKTSVVKLEKRLPTEQFERDLGEVISLRFRM